MHSWPLSCKFPSAKSPIVLHIYSKSSYQQCRIYLSWAQGLTTKVALHHWPKACCFRRQQIPKLSMQCMCASHMCASLPISNQWFRNALQWIRKISLVWLTRASSWQSKMGLTPEPAWLLLPLCITKQACTAHPSCGQSLTWNWKIGCGHH